MSAHTCVKNLLPNDKKNLYILKLKGLYCAKCILNFHVAFGKLVYTSMSTPVTPGAKEITDEKGLSPSPTSPVPTPPTSQTPQDFSAWPRCPKLPQPDKGTHSGFEHESATSWDWGMSPNCLTNRGHPLKIRQKLFDRVPFHEAASWCLAQSRCSRAFLSERHELRG